MLDEYTARELTYRAPGYVVKTVRRWWATWYMRRYFRCRPDHPSRSREPALEALHTAESALVLCWGNVCRSPMAARYLAAQCDEYGLDLEVTSAGLGEREGRSSPDAAVAAARSYGVDLSTHRSNCVDREQITSFDIVFVMDHPNYYDIVTRFPEVRERTYFLGALERNEGSAVPIGDPYGSDRSTFDATYGRIAEVIDQAVAAIAVERTE